MHPIIKDFIYTDDKLSDIIERHYDKNNFFETTILKLFKSINHKEIDPQLYLDLDQAVIKGHSDTNVYLLFMFFVIRFMSFRKQFERANVIQSIGYSLNNENVHPIVQSLFLNSVATLRSFENNWPECNRLMKESVALFDKTNPRYISLLLGTASLLSQQGKLKELDEDDLNRLKNITHDQLAFTSVGARLTNCILTCNYVEANSLMKDYKRLYRGDISTSVNIMQDLLRMISGDFNESNYLEEESKPYVKLLGSLSKGNIEDALKQFQEFQTIDPGYLKLNRYSGYMPLNIELCLRNKGKARLLLLELKKKGGSYFLEDFFLARVQLLENNKSGAVESFQRLVDNLNKYDALNLLAYELQFAKELSPADILELMEEVKEDSNLKSQIPKPSSQIVTIQQDKGLEVLVGDSIAILKVKDLIKKFANLKEPVLITGETGTGKELVSRAIHEHGPFANAPFLAINCGALTESLLQSELFGYVAGAFTGAQKERKGIFEAAGKGTVFLDEFGEISPQMQASLLRLLESNEIRLIGDTKTRQIECKIVVATNVDLLKAVVEKKFREDLYFRLTRFDIKLPPLRERLEDVPKLINYFLLNNGNKKGRHQEFSKDFLMLLTKYQWPGNIRELKNEIERILILYPDKEVLNVEDFDLNRLQGLSSLKPKEEKIQIITPPPKNKPAPRQLKLDPDQIQKILQTGSKFEERQKVFKKLFQRYKKLTRSQLIEILEINPGSVSKGLKNLCEIGYIKKIMPTKSVKSHYFVLIE